MFLLVCLHDQRRSKGGFSTEKEAWEYARDTWFCKHCRNFADHAACAGDFVVHPQKEIPSRVIEALLKFR